LGNKHVIAFNQNFRIKVLLYWVVIQHVKVLDGPLYRTLLA